MTTNTKIDVESEFAVIREARAILAQQGISLTSILYNPEFDIWMINAVRGNRGFRGGYERGIIPQGAATLAEAIIKQLDID